MINIPLKIEIIKKPLIINDFAFPPISDSTASGIKRKKAISIPNLGNKDKNVAKLNDKKYKPMFSGEIILARNPDKIMPKNIVKTFPAEAQRPPINKYERKELSFI